MPTGYTSSVGDGKVTNFIDFAKQCARAFGACIMQRDEGLSSDIIIDEPSDHNAKELQVAIKKYKDFKKKTSKELMTWVIKTKKEQINNYEDMINERKLIQQRYEAMLEKVKSWIPPTKDHINLKEFMIKQLKESIDFDCDLKYYYEQLEQIKIKTNQEIIDEQIKDYEWSIEYHSKANKDELDRVKERNQWKKDLIKSLKSLESYK